MGEQARKGPETTKRIPKGTLGGTALQVSRLGFGTYDFGVESQRVTPEEGGRILAEAFRLGVTLWDTSDDYGSHPHVASALRHVPREEVVISTKTSARSGTEARKSLANSLEELGTDYVDVFLLHNVQADRIDHCCRLLKELEDLKMTGKVRALGLSTHSVTVVEEASGIEEADVILTILCSATQAAISRWHEEIPLEDGRMNEMFDAAKSAHHQGKGVLAMKALGTGVRPLVRRYRSAIRSIATLPFVDAVLVGMKNLTEVKKNVEVVALA